MTTSAHDREAVTDQVEVVGSSQLAGEEDRLTWRCSGPLKGLLVLIIIAGCAKFAGLGHLDIWGDEIYSHNASSEFFSQMLQWSTPGNESSSPWPFIEIKIARQVFGVESPWSIRFPAAFHGFLAVLLLYLFIGRYLNWSTAFLAAVLLAVHPFAQEWTREGRMYGHFLSSSIMLTWIAYEAVRYARQEDACPLNWRWWTVGVMFNLVHASNVMGVMMIAVVGLWLGLAGVMALAHRRKLGFGILGGAALATFVYLTSWSLTGIGKILMLMRNSKPAEGFVKPELSDNVMKFVDTLGGLAPFGLSWLVCGLAVVGLISLFVKDRSKRMFVLLIAMVSMSGWIAYPSIAKTHFFTSRYVFTALLGVSFGLGFFVTGVKSWLANRSVAMGKVAAPVLVVLILIMWSSYSYTVVCVPKMEIRKALAPIQSHGQRDEVLIFMPDWYISFDSYKPYTLSNKVRIIRGPHGTWFQPESDESFEGEFENLFPSVKVESEIDNSGQNTGNGSGNGDAAVTRTANKIINKSEKDKVEELPLASPPAATWLFLLRDARGNRRDKAARWDKVITEMSPVLQAYHLTKQDLVAHVGPDVFTLTVRLSKGRITHIVQTQGRN